MIDIEALQNMDPILFEQMQPYVQQVVSRFGGGRDLTETDITQMAYQVVSGSLSQFYPPAGYDLSMLIDIARLLVLISLNNTYGYNLNRFWQL